jgi:hypothetical protein
MSQLEYVIADYQQRVRGSCGIVEALQLSDAFADACREGEPIPRWALVVRAMVAKYHLAKGQFDKLQELEDKCLRLETQLEAFRTAAEHVTENGATKRTMSSSDGWAMCHVERLTDLEVLEEKMMRIRELVND